MESETPFVSIVMPSYNQVQFLETALRSVLEQSYPKLELIVIDGGSTDGSREVIEKYSGRLAYWQSSPDKGQADAINQGFRRASGKYVAWLNSDDVYLPGAIKEAVEVLESDPTLGMVYADGLMVDAGLHLLDRHTYPQVDLVSLLCFEVILQPAVFMRADVLKEVGYLDSSYNLLLDHELWVRIAARHPLKHVSSWWALERTHPDAKTIAQAEGFVDEARRLVTWAWQQSGICNRIEVHRSRVEAGLKIFSARRFIDAGRYRTAFHLLMQAFRLHPGSVMRYWYKVIQAGLSAVGLAQVFEFYRKTRRRITHREQVVAWEAQRSEQPGGDGNKPAERD